jgi:ribosomal protein S18 acetylase RimI-like enzyme
MPETRAAKRVKLSNPAQTPVPKAVPLAPHEAHLQRLNSHSSAIFHAKYIPDEKLTFQSQKRPDAKYKLSYHNVQHLPHDDLNRSFALIVQTSKDDYALSSRGWHPRRKHAEMKEDSMRYIIVRKQELNSQREDGQGREDVDISISSSTTASPQPSVSSRDSGIANITGNEKLTDLDHFGFLSYQLDDDWTVHSDDRIPVLYLYEIHLGKNLRGIGMGAHLMDLAKHIAQATSMEKVELSVFRRNARAEQFYRSLGYEIDETSPTTVKKGKKHIETDWLVLSLKLNKTPGEEEAGPLSS